MFFFKRKARVVPVMPEQKPTLLSIWRNSTTTKRLVWVLMLHSCMWLDCSYLLAWTGHEQIAESLSSNVCSVIIGGIIGYMFTSTTENISKYNPKFGGTPMSDSTNYTEPIAEPDECEPETEDVELAPDEPVEEPVPDTTDTEVTEEVEENEN